MADAEDIDLTLNGLMLPDGVKHDFGSTPSGAADAGNNGVRQGIGTEDLARDIMLPFANQRPVDVDESCGTTAVECNRTIRFTNKTTILLAIGCATFDGCVLTFIGAGSADANVKLRNTETTLLTVKSGEDAALIWKDGEWRVPTEIDARKSADDALRRTVAGDVTPRLESLAADMTAADDALGGRIDKAVGAGNNPKGAGSATTPIYFGADGAPHAITSYAGNAATATKVNQKLTVDNGDANRANKSYDGSAAVSITKADVGLGSVDNTADASKTVAKAAALTTSAGLATKGVYFKDGKPVAMTYSVNKDVPKDAKFTDTTYLAATRSAEGLMSKEDKAKLDGVDAGANKTVVDSALSSSSTNPVQNKVVNSALAGHTHTKSQITDFPSIPTVGNGTITITQNGTAKGSFTTNQGGNTTIALTDSNTVYTHPTASGSKHIPAGGSSGQILRWSADGTAAWGADSNTTYSPATTSLSGLMSASDKTKLNGISAGANKVTFSLSGNDMTITVG